VDEDKLKLQCGECEAVYLVAARDPRDFMRCKRCGELLELPKPPGVSEAHHATDTVPVERVLGPAGKVFLVAVVLALGLLAAGAPVLAILSGCVGLVVTYLVFVDDAKQAAFKKAGATEQVEIGRYLGGLPDDGAPTTDIEGVICGVTENEFVFVVGLGDQIGRIPRDGINEIFIDDRSQIAQRLTVTRMVTLGIFSLAVPKKKKHKELCLVIDWDDGRGVRQNTVFEFTGTTCQQMANEAAAVLKRHQKPKAVRLGVDERKCPFCAEVIKAEAQLCRYCHSALDGPDSADADN